MVQTKRCPTPPAGACLLARLSLDGVITQDYDRQETNLTNIDYAKMGNQKSKKTSVVLCSAVSRQPAGGVVVYTPARHTT